MLNKFIEKLTTIPATIIGGIFLLLSLIAKDKLPIDPALFSIVINGLPLLYSAVKKLICNSGISKISSALLISIAMTAAVLTDDLFAAGEVAFIMALGEILEDMTTNRAKKGLKKLIALAPTQGRIIVDGHEKTIAAKDIAAGDILRILPGEAIPVDGIIISGETSIDQSVVTGESLPADKSIGDDVFCGTINRFGSIDIKATKVGEDSSLQKLIRMVQDAENKKAPMARTMDKWASYLVPVALIAAIVTGVLTQDITRAVTTLVVFCPCALVLATPTAIMAAIGQATKHGVIIKSGEALEKMGNADIIAFDKTGTLTHGKLCVCDTVSFDDTLDQSALLALAASAESKSEHPLGKAIVSSAKEKGLKLIEADEFKMISGKGISAACDGKKLIIGNEKMCAEHGIMLSSEILSLLETFRSQGKASLLIAQNSKCLGIISLSDTLREESKEIVSKLKTMNTDVVLLTGDSKKTAQYFAKQAGITNIHAELLPEHKVERILTLQQQAKKVCMVGDGINDAPALKTANVGIAMGSMGSDIAVEAADIALMSDAISKLPYLKRLSTATIATIKLSISLSMIINILAVFLSASGVLNPTTGALVHNAGSCFVVLIAALLYDRKFE
ncbi:MAG: cation-translocating P-type ATPase [Clostridia bacterium]|nr:cation-translocating P-type ATPase [Clostridia bacterium]